MSRILFVILVGFFSMNSCQNLDSNLFNPYTDIDAYLLDEYEGEREFHIDEKYTVDEDEITHFTAPSAYGFELATIQGIYLGDLNTLAEDTIIVYCHGNKGHMDFYWDRLKLLYYTGGKSNYGALMMDYRGFGLSDGTISEPALASDVSACIDWLIEKGAQDKNMILYGFSLGSIPAVQICAENDFNPLKLILEAPIGNIDVMVQGGSSLSMPASFFTDIEADNIERIKGVEEPLLWIHGTNDTYLPLNTHGQPIFENHGGTEKQKLLVDEGDHGTTPFVMGVEAYMDALHGFIIQ